MSHQLELFPPVQFLNDSEVDIAVIDAALHHVENQSVLRALLEGKPFSHAFGVGGASTPVMWMADAKGIEIWTEPRRLIKPAQILARAKEYKKICREIPI